MTRKEKNMDNPELVKLDNGQILCSICSKTFLLMGTAKVHFSDKHSFISEIKTKKNLGDRPRKNPVGRPKKNHTIDQPNKNSIFQPKNNPDKLKKISVGRSKTHTIVAKKNASVRAKKKRVGQGCKSKYSFKFQLKIIEEAKLLNNNTEVGRKHGMSEACVRRWRKNEAEIRGKIFKKSDDENVDLNENTETGLGNKLPELKIKKRKTTMKISMKINDSQAAVKEIILENSGDASSISENIYQNDTINEDFSPSKSENDTVITGGLRLSSSSSNEFNIQTSSSSPEDGKEIRPEKSFDKHPKDNSKKIPKDEFRICNFCREKYHWRGFWLHERACQKKNAGRAKDDEDYIPSKIIGQRFSPLGQARFRVRQQKQLRENCRILNRSLLILDEEQLTGLEKMNDLHPSPNTPRQPNYLNDSGMIIGEENEKEFLESVLDSSKVISTPSFETVENSTTKLYKRIWKEKLNFSKNTGLLDDNHENCLILNRPLPILDEEQLTGLEKMKNPHPSPNTPRHHNYSNESGIIIGEKNKKEFLESTLNSSKIILTPSFENVENSTTKLYGRIWKEKQALFNENTCENRSEITSGRSLNDDDIENMGKEENITAPSDDMNEHTEASPKKSIILVEHPEPSTYIMDFALVSDSDDEDGKVVCFICPFAFSNLSDAEHHFKEKHTDGLKSEKSIGIQDSTF